MFAYMNTQLYSHACAQSHAHTCLLYSCINSHMHTTNSHLHSHTSTCMPMHAYSHAHIHMLSYTHRHVYSHIYSHSTCRTQGTHTRSSWRCSTWLAGILLPLQDKAGQRPRLGSAFSLPAVNGNCICQPKGSVEVTLVPSSHPEPFAEDCSCFLNEKNMRPVTCQALAVCSDSFK